MMTTRFQLLPRWRPQAVGRAGAASPRRGLGVHLPGSGQGAGSPRAPGVAGASRLQPPASARKLVAGLTQRAWIAMVVDRVEGCSRRGRGIKLPGLRLRRPSPRSPTSWR